MGFIKVFRKFKNKSAQKKLENLTPSRYFLELIMNSDELDDWNRRLHRDYLDASIMLSDTFELDFNVHGVIESCRIIYSLESFVESQFTKESPKTSPVAVAMSDEVPIVDLGGYVADLDFGGIYRDSQIGIVWTGSTTETQVEISGGVVLYFNKCDEIVGVSAPYSTLEH